MRFRTYYCHTTLYLCLCAMLITGQVPGEKHRQFADVLTNELYTNANECTSSWGVSMVFDLLRPGSTGDTSKQLCDMFGLCGPQNELMWNHTVSDLQAGYDGRCHAPGGDDECLEEAPTVKVANSIWIDNSSQLEPTYSNVVGEYLHQTDFDSPDAGETVNEWVNETTMGLIDSILQDGPIPFSLVAINSIYLKAFWSNPFPSELTNEDLFYTDVSRTEALPAKAHFMHTVQSMPYSDNILPGHQIIRLDYVRGGFTEGGSCHLSMLVVLPTETSAAPVSSQEVVGALPLLDYRRVALALPKFRIESTYSDELKRSLIRLGLTAPFGGGEGFCGLLEGNLCQYISFIIQKTFIEVDEKGTIAAAATAVGLRGIGNPPPNVDLFLADHPFQFFMYSECGDIILFEGRVGSPSIHTDWPLPSYQPKHRDADFYFWTGDWNIDNPFKTSTTTGPSPIQSTQTQSSVQPTQPSENPFKTSTTTGPSPIQSTQTQFSVQPAQPSENPFKTSTTTGPPPMQSTQTQFSVQPAQPSEIRDDDPDTSVSVKHLVPAHWTAIVALCSVPALLAFT